MATARILSSLSLSLSIFLSACFDPAPSSVSSSDGTTSLGETGDDDPSTTARPDASTTGSAGATAGVGSGETGGSPPDASSSTGESVVPEGSSTSGDASTGGVEESSSTGAQVASDRTVFLLPRVGAPMSFAGLAGADSLCQEAAESAGLGGTFMAWLSIGTVSGVLTRFSVEGGPFVLVDGTEIAADWDDLTDGTLAAPILMDADGFAYQPNASPERYVITHTNADGAGAGGVIPCSGFTADSIIEARWGDAGASDASWTQTGDSWACDSATSGGPSLYCFEQ